MVLRAIRNDAEEDDDAKKKGPLALASGPSRGRKRPRRAAITRKRYRTATICDRAAQNARAFELFPLQKIRESPDKAKKSQTGTFYHDFNKLEAAPSAGTLSAGPVTSNSRFRDRRCHQKFHRCAA